MWLMVARELKPDAPYWPGRRLLAAVDAVVWPLLWVLAFSHAPKPVGLVGPFVATVALVCALGRPRRALRVNHRYWFTTWRWGRIAAALLLMGLVLNFALIAVGAEVIQPINGSQAVPRSTAQDRSGAMRPRAPSRTGLGNFFSAIN